jgi:ribonuclease HI
MNDSTDLTLAHVVFTDGAASGNPGPGGWAATIRSPEGEIYELGGPDPDTTNNRMEMTGVLRALAHLARTEGQVAIFTDSMYVIRGITQWIWGWRKRGWKKSDGGDVTNQDLWKKLFTVTYARKPAVIWRYVPGHAGVPGNERCDQIAVGYSKHRRVRLYRGPEQGYDVDLTILPPEAPLPEMKERKPKAKAHSYLSDVGGQLVRHDSWASCESRVKGRSGARFKKTKSAANEVEILQDWGYSPSDLS